MLEIEMGAIRKPASIRPRPPHPPFRKIDFGGSHPSGIEISEIKMGFPQRPAPGRMAYDDPMPVEVTPKNMPDFNLKKGFFVSLEQAKQQALADLFLAPISVIPAVIGATAGIVGWGNSGPAWLFLAAVGGVLGSIGIVSSRFLFSFEGMVSNALKKLEEGERNKKRDELLALYDRLSSDGDSRDNDALTQLVEFYSEFNNSVRNNEVNIAGKSLICEKVDNLFEGCVKTLDHQYTLFQAQKSLAGTAREKLKDQRERELQDVIKTVSQLGDILSRCLDMTKQNQSSTTNVSTLREDLEATMNAAAKTEQRMATVRENNIRV